MSASDATLGGLSFTNRLTSVGWKNYILFTALNEVEYEANRYGGYAFAGVGVETRRSHRHELPPLTIVEQS